MDIDTVRDLLLQAQSVEDRQKVVSAAIAGGISLQRLEELLDWLDHVLASNSNTTDENRSNDPEPRHE